MQFEPGTQFFDVEGLPVTVSEEGACRAWDYPEPRKFPLSSVYRNGMPISEEKFRQLVEHDRTANPRP